MSNKRKNFSGLSDIFGILGLVKDSIVNANKKCWVWSIQALDSASEPPGLIEMTLKVAHFD